MENESIVYIRRDYERKDKNSEWVLVKTEEQNVRKDLAVSYKNWADNVKWDKNVCNAEDNFTFDKILKEYVSICQNSKCVFTLKEEK